MLTHENQRLVTQLGLHTNLAECNVPPEDVPEIAAKALGSKDHPDFPLVVRVLEGLYPAQ